VALATPYIDEVNTIEERWLKDNGIEVTASAGGGIAETADIQECEPGVAYERARAVDSPEAEAIFISCTGFRTLEIIERLEAELGKPVISANQATFADCLRHLGMHQVAPGCGSLFAHIFAAPQAPPAGRPAAE
jgi:maleate cis-trans isomerase